MESSRRDFLTLGGAALAAGTLGTSAFGAEDDAYALRSELLFVMEAQLEPGQPVGATPHGNRSIVYAKGGTIKGPKVNGTVLPGGGDWFRVRPDGVGEVDVRATFKTDDGALVYTHYKGILNLKNGYFRTTPRFETSSEKYGWLNDIVAVGVGGQIPGGVKYHVYHIL